jgi:FkbM family methyltransferase
MLFLPPFIRNLAERLSRNVTFPARLPKRFGRRKIWLSPGNHLAVLKPGEAKFEGYLLDFAERFVNPGDVVWDIGANMGMFAIPAAHRAAFTLAIEPDPFNQNLLHKSMAANPDLKIDILPAALSNSFGIAKFDIPVRGRSANSLAATNFGTQTGGVRQEFSVLTVTADWVLDHFPKPDFIKCDAEGAETWILEGAARLLAEVRPVIIIEMPNENADACAAIFKANRYVMTSSYTPVDPAKLVDDIHDVWDVLAIPEEKLAGLVGR